MVPFKKAYIPLTKMVPFQKMAKIGQQKWYHLRIFNLALLNPQKLNPFLTLGMKKKGFKMVKFQNRPKFRQQNGSIRKSLKFINKNGAISKKAKIGQQKRYHLGIFI